MNSPNVTEELLAFLATKKTKHIRLRVSEHPNIDIDTQNLLAKDICPDVRFNIATHPNANPSALRHLADDEDEHIRRKVASHPNADAATLNWLAATNVDPMVLCSVASHPNTTPDTLHRFVRGEEHYVKNFRRNKPFGPYKAAKLMAQKYHQKVLAFIARNPNTSTETLDVLANNTPPTIRRQVASHPNVSDEALEIIKQRFKSG